MTHPIIYNDYICKSSSYYLNDSYSADYIMTKIDDKFKKLNRQKFFIELQLLFNLFNVSEIPYNGGYFNFCGIQTKLAIITRKGIHIPPNFCTQTEVVDIYKIFFKTKMTENDSNASKKSISSLNFNITNYNFEKFDMFINNICTDDKIKIYELKIESTIKKTNNPNNPNNEYTKAKDLLLSLQNDKEKDILKMKILDIPETIETEEITENVVVKFVSERSKSFFYIVFEKRRKNTISKFN